MGLYAKTLPDFPWDTLRSIRDIAARYPAGEIDLTIGSPVDPVPRIAIDALSEAAESHAYPPNVGSRHLREAIRGWLRECRGVLADIDVLPALGEKELVAMLPSLLGLGSGDIVAFPDVAYPTYDVGARLAGAEPLPLDVESDPHGWRTDISLLWLNSPSNPTGHVLAVHQLQRIVAWAREHGVIVASDECYAALVWSGDGVDVSGDAAASAKESDNALHRDACVCSASLPYSGKLPMAPSILEDSVCGGDASGLLMLYSLSKQSNLAGYRAAFIAGDRAMMAQLRELRKHTGMMMPGPIQRAMTAVLRDQQHVRDQYQLYARRRDILLEALPEAGLVNDPQDTAGLYLWVRRAGMCTGNAGDKKSKENAEVSQEAAANVTNPQESPAWELVESLAKIGIIAAPGFFYGANAECMSHVRISLTASDVDIRDAASRLLRLPAHASSAC